MLNRPALGVVAATLLLPTAALAQVPNPGPPPVPFSAEDAPHLLNCTVVDTLQLNDSGSLVLQKPLPPGARAIGRVTSFVVDTITGVVRMPGLGNIAWIMVKGRGTGEPEIIVTPTAGLESATTISIHIHRRGDEGTFVFFETDRVMSGTCVLLK